MSRRQPRAACTATGFLRLGVVLMLLLVPEPWGLTAPAVAQWPSTDSRVFEPLARGQVNWTEGLIMGRASVSGSTRPAARLATQQAAIREARRHVLALLEHVRLNARQTLAEGLRHVATAPQQLAELAAQAEIVETRYQAGGAVETVVQVAMVGPLTALVMPPDASVRPDSDASSEAVHTGIVIDARGLALQPAMLPNLVDERGQPLYTPASVGQEAAVQQGYVAYARAFDQAPAQGRIGARPLVLRALRVVDEARVDLVLSQADAARLRDYGATRRLLQQCRVLIVM